MVPEAPEHDAYLTLSQATRLHTRHALPPIDDLLDALGHAATLAALPESKRAVLAQAAKGIRAVCRPDPVVVVADQACQWCPAGIGALVELALGHDKAAHHTYAALLKAGFDDPALVAATPTTQLAAVPRVGPHGLKMIRRALAQCGGDDD